METFKPHILDRNDYKEEEELADEVRKLINSKHYFKAIIRFFKGWKELKKKN